MKEAAVIIFCLLTLYSLTGQENWMNSSMKSPSLLGYMGLGYVPSAYTVDWREVQVGFSHIPIGEAITYQLDEVDPTQRAERTLMTNFGFLPFFEFSFRVTRPYQIQGRNFGIGDRSITGRLQILKETKRRPALLIGINDLGSESSFFNTNYLVLSKTRHFKNWRVNGNIGYGFKISDARRHYLIGLFTGIQGQWKNWIGFVEYDAAQINLGIGAQIKQFLSLKAALMNGQNFTGSIVFKYKL